MNPLPRIAGRAADRALGLPTPAVPYVVRRDGRVAMPGASYLGHTQWAVAPYADPPLVSVSLNVTTARFSEAFYEHGAPTLQNALNWTGQVGRQERGPFGVIPNPRQMARMK